MHLKRDDLHNIYLLTKQNAIKTASPFVASIRIPKKHNTDKRSNCKKHKRTEPEDSICRHNNAPGSVAMNDGIHHFTSSVIYTNGQRFCGIECCQCFLCRVMVMLARGDYYALQFMRAEAAINNIDNH
jgi:hypothetical protein